MQAGFKIFIALAVVLYGMRSGAQQFFNPLFIPPTLSGNNINLTENSGVHQFYPGVNTPTWGYNGNFLGPTLLFNQGDSVDIDVTNNLPDTTTTHWHGLIVPAKFDGGPHTLILPGNTWSVHFRIRNQASTHWYHPHGNMKTNVQVTNGLAGLIIVKDTIESKLNLPTTYGVDDIPLILQDRTYDSVGNFIPVALGDSMLVNGTANPFVNLPAQVVRLRNLNASTGRFYNIGFNDNRNFYVIASDASLLQAPYQTNRIMIGVGERYEILADLTTDNPGDSIFLMSYGSEMGWKVPGGGNLTGEQSPLNAVDFRIMKINVVSKTSLPVLTVPPSLISLVPIDTTLIGKSRTKHITGTGMVGSGLFYFDGPSFNMNVINDTVFSGSVEKWIFTNSSTITHPVHIHGVSFYIIDRNGNPPLPYEAGWKDVFLIHPNLTANESVSVIMKFENYVDDTIPYMYHCHLLRHEDMGMMHSYIVINGNGNGIDDPDNNAPIDFVYPNPSSGVFKFNSFYEVVGVKYQLMVYDVYGREVKSNFISSSSEVNISYSPQGVYFYQLMGESKKIASGKLIIK